MTDNPIKPIVFSKEDMESLKALVKDSNRHFLPKEDEKKDN
jgi:hypothetical protein